jgi:hypothetical protein
MGLASEGVVDRVATNKVGEANPPDISGEQKDD